MPTNIEQARQNRQLRYEARLAATRDRLRQRTIMQQLRARRRTTIRVTVGREAAERAEAGCFATYGMNLTTYLSDVIGSLADIIARDSERLLKNGSGDDQEWFEMTAESVRELPGGSQLSAQQVFDLLHHGSVANHDELRRVGRVMKRLRWIKRRPVIDGRQVWVYVKPLELADEIAPRTQWPESTPSEQPATPVISPEPRELTYEEKLVAAAREKYLVVQAQRRREWAEKHKQDG
jgi:hypothetical protein